MGCASVLACSVYLLSIASVVLAIYEDQVGKMDWRRQFVGYPKMVKFSTNNLGGVKSLFFVSQDNVIASIDARSGEIIWRHSFETTIGSSIEALLLDKTSLVIVRNGGAVLQNLDQDSSALRWQAALEYFPCNWTKLLQSNGRLYAVTCTAIRSFDMSSGKAIHDMRLPLPSANIVGLDVVLDAESEATLLVAVAELNKMSVFSVNLQRGAVDLVVQFSRQCLEFSMIDHSLVCIDSTGEMFVNNMRKNSQISLGMVGKEAKVRLVDNRLFCSVGSTKVECFVNNIGHEKFVPFFHHAIAEPTCAVDVHSVGEGEGEEVAISVVGKDNLRLTLYSGVNGTKLTSRQLPLSSNELFSFTKIFLPEKWSLSSSKLPRMILVVTKDATVSLLHANGEPFWIRYESLASVVSAELVDLPLSERETIIEKEFSAPLNNTWQMFINRISNELLMVKSYLLRCLNDLIDLASFLGENDWMSLASFSPRSSNSLVRDQFGLHKMLVVGTRQGRVFGIDSKTGHILWTFRVENCETVGESFPMFLQRTTALHPYPAQCALALKSASTGLGVIVTFNPITGQLFQRVHLSFSIKFISLAPLVNDVGIAGLVIWPQDDKMAYVFPANARPSDSVKSEGKPIYLFVVDRQSSVANSFQLLNPVPSDQWEDIMPWAVSKSVTVKLGAENDNQVVHFAMKSLDAKVHSQGRVLGNRSVLYKYLNPNMGVAMMKSQYQGADLITIVIIDTITGQVFYTTKQKRVFPPYQLLLCENWIVYSYWNEKYRRTEINVIEMYEGEKQSNPGVFSSKFPVQPLIYHQSYIFPQLVTAMAVTETQRAITPRFLLLAMPFGGVVEIPKSFLDPRRTVNLTQELRDEGVIPYAPDLPIATDHIINYNRSLLRVHGLHTSPSDMESTCLVFVFGLDLFLTRVNPSGTFDVLKDGFDRWFIVFVLFALSSAALITKKLARRKEITTAWR